ncbi:hypothetical protein ERJ75_000369000 [Trypanosoma vivax]|nr:hypothetical protein ERJ75_000369000 [Trypanosoma vivax]
MVPRPRRPSCVGRVGRGRDVRCASGPVWRSPVGKCLRDGSLSVVRSRVHSKWARTIASESGPACLPRPPAECAQRANSTRIRLNGHGHARRPGRYAIPTAVFCCWREETQAAVRVECARSPPVRATATLAEGKARAEPGQQRTSPGKTRQAKRPRRG